MFLCWSTYLATKFYTISTFLQSPFYFLLCCLFYFLNVSNVKYEYTKVHIYLHLNNIHMYVWIKINTLSHRSIYEILCAPPRTHCSLPTLLFPELVTIQNCASWPKFFLHTSLISYYLGFLVFEFVEMNVYISLWLFYSVIHCWNSFT